MRRGRLVGVLAATLVFVVASTVEGQVGSAVAPSTDTAADTAVRSIRLEATVRNLMAAHGVPGAALVVVEGDSVVFQEGFGLARVEGSVPFDAARTSFRLASVAKLFVATVLGDLAAKGVVDLAADISETVPEIPLDGRYDAPLSLHHLLTHTAGLDERLVGYAAESRDGIRPLGEYLAARLPDRGWPPGEVIGYSNHGMALAAYVAERTTGTPFDQLAGELIFAPLGMTSTRYLDPRTGPELTHATGHSCTPIDDAVEGSTEGGCTPLAEIYSHPYPVGLAYSTAADMGRFLLAHLNPDGLADDMGVAPEGIRMVQAEQFTQAPGLPGMSYGFFNQPLRGSRALAHAGSVPGIRTLLIVVPERQVGFFFVANGGDSEFGEELRDALAEELLGDDAMRPTVGPGDPGSVTVPVEALEALAGTYQMARYPHRTVEGFSMRFGTTAPVLVDPDAGPGLYFDGRSYAPVDSLRFREVGGDRLLQFEYHVPTRQMRLYASTAVFGAELPAAYERLPWYGAPGFLNEYLSYLLALPFLLLILGWPLLAAGALWMKRRRISKGVDATPAAPGQVRGQAIALLGAVTFNILFAFLGFGFIARATRMFETSTGIVYGMTPRMQWILMISWVLVPLAGLMLVAAVKSWRQGYWGVIRRTLYTGLTLAACLAIQFLVQWHYLPPPMVTG
jgi:CubicO group peptidase (beta-lactamase class C family)